MDTGRIGSRGTSSTVGSARDRRRTSVVIGRDDDDRPGPDGDRRHRDLVRIDGVVFDRNAPRGTYLNILI
ncbi:MAG: hypothetical protein LDL26_12620 [Caenispirillum bisanense]|nr:hypothetical protein [Caenispirillum bisanense]MCA1975054.1 hypothetical protein [Caenispirillum sp.]